MKLRLKHILAMSIIALVMAFVPFVTPATTTYAYSDDYTTLRDMKQTDFSETSATVVWTANNCASTKIYVKNWTDYSTDYKLVGTTADTIYTITGLSPGNMYDVKIEGVSPDGQQIDYCTLNYVETKVAKPKVKQDTWYHYIEDASISWECQQAADSYEVIWYNAAGKKVRSKNDTFTSDTLGKVKNSNVYQAKVRAIQEFNGQTYRSDWTTIKVFEQPWIVKGTKIGTSKGKKCLTIKWTKQKGATGYDVYVSTNNKSFKKVKTLGKTKNALKITKFKGKKLSKKAYYVYVISKTKLNGKTNKSGLVYSWKVTTSGASESYYNGKH